MDASKARAHIPEPTYFSYNSRDAIIYALGVGANSKTDLNYIYENASEFQVLPSFLVAPGFPSANIMDWPGIEFDLTRILHGEQYIELYEPLPCDGKLRSEGRVVDILDKGSGALILIEITTYDDTTGKKIGLQQMGTFQIGSGNFGGARTSKHEKSTVKIPERTPDAIVEEKTWPNQAALYRMGGGDLNPLHVDPNFAKMSGFKQPILHGLCTLGFATRHVLNVWADNDSERFKSMKVRFSSPVLPGETLLTETWKDGNRILFQTKVKESGKIVISNAYVELTQASETPKIPEHLSSKL